MLYRGLERDYPTSLLQFLCHLQPSISARKARAPPKNVQRIAATWNSIPQRQAGGPPSGSDFRSAEGRRKAEAAATESLFASVSKHLQPITLKHHEENLPPLTRSVAMYVPNLGQLRDVAQALAVPQSRVGCALSLSVHPEGRRYTSDKIGIRWTGSAGSPGLLLCGPRALEHRRHALPMEINFGDSKPYRNRLATIVRGIHEGSLFPLDAAIIGMALIYLASEQRAPMSVLWNKV